MYEGRGVTSIRFARTRLTISRFPQGPRSAQCGLPNQVRTLIARLTDRKRAKQAHLVGCGAAGAGGIVPPRHRIRRFGPGRPWSSLRRLAILDVAVGTGLLPAPRADPGVRLSRTGLLSEVQRGRRAGPSPTRRSVGESHACRTFSGAGSGVPRDPLPLLPSGVLPSTPSAAGHPGLVRALRRYYYPVRLLTPSSTASPPRLPVAALNRSRRLWAE